MTALLADPDPATVAARAAATFSDRVEAWRFAVNQSVDVQIAAVDAAAVADGTYLAVIGDAHPGNNPLIQGVFAHRHPDPAGFLAHVAADVGPAVAFLLPPWGPGLGVDARGINVVPPSAITITAMPGARAQGGGRSWAAPELLVDGGDLVDRDGTLRVALIDAFAMPIFVTAVRTFELLGGEDHAPRVTIGRTVLRRESWSIPAAEVPQRAEDVATFARGHGMPRRLFAKSPLERKPMYLDVESPVLGRILCRHARQAAADAPAARMSFTEMLPAPEHAWLTGPAAQHYVCELRLVATERRRGGAGQA
jgi:hypothetical protein